MNASFVGRRWLVRKWEAWRLANTRWDGIFEFAQGRYNESGCNRGTNDIVCIEDLL
jgi:hypothetical protein